LKSGKKEEEQREIEIDDQLSGENPYTLTFEREK
jgi:hypothetical protein